MALSASTRLPALQQWLGEQAHCRTSFRLVRPGDAAFILQLRTGAERAKYLSAVCSDLAAQRDWISSYQQREAQGEEFYFIIHHQDKDVGAVRMYDFRPDSFSWGSWITLPGTPGVAALNSATMIYQIAQEAFQFTHSHFEVRRDNERVNRFHRRLNAQVIREDDLNYYYSVALVDALARLPPLES